MRKECQGMINLMIPVVATTGWSGNNDGNNAIVQRSTKFTRHYKAWISRWLTKAQGNEAKEQVLEHSLIEENREPIEVQQPIPFETNLTSFGEEPDSELQDGLRDWYEDPDQPLPASGSGDPIPRAKSKAKPKSRPKPMIQRDRSPWSLRNRQVAWSINVKPRVHWNLQVQHRQFNENMPVEQMKWNEIWRKLTSFSFFWIISILWYRTSQNGISKWSMLMDPKERGCQMFWRPLSNRQE